MSPRRFGLTVFVAVALSSVLTLAFCIFDLFPRGRESLQGTRSVVVVFGLAPIFNGIVMLGALWSAVMEKSSGPRASCVIAALAIPLVGVAINVLIFIALLPSGGPGIWEGAH